MNQGDVVAVIGSQWGDEGKGKMVDIISGEADITVRFQGGSNAGHTIVRDGQVHKFHLLPSAVLHGGKTIVLGNGMVIDPVTFCEELPRARETETTVIVSARAQIILPVHKLMDKIDEICRRSSIGTTHRGIGPAYGDKIDRKGIRFVDLLHLDELEDTDFDTDVVHTPEGVIGTPDPLVPRVLRRLEEFLLEKRNRLTARIQTVEIEDNDRRELLEEIRDHTDPKALYKWLKGFQFLGEHIKDTAVFLHQAQDAKKKILLEGAQGVLLDIDHGTYPYVTSSTTTIGGALAGSGLPASCLTEVIGIVKAYTTRVGSGPFPTELFDEVGDRIQSNGGEFGTTTGRRRRCGWVDLVALRYAARLNGFSSMAIMKLDVLCGIPELKLCVAYDLDGERLTSFPSDPTDLKKVKPIYESMDPIPAFDAASIREGGFDALPVEARNYLDRLRDELGVPIKSVSFSPDQKDTIFL